MDIQKLVHMANQIADFFDADPDQAAAVEAVASHIRGFWDPRMRQQLLDWVEQNQGEGLKPTSLLAVTRLRG